MINYTLIRSNRKTIQICVRNRDGSVEVRAPNQLSKQFINRYVAGKEEWITRNLTKITDRINRRNIFTLAYGSHILFRGKEYPITEKEGDSACFDGCSFCIPPKLTPEQIKKTCIGIYRDLARSFLTERTLEIAEHMSVEPTAIKINNAKSRWGSCTSIGTINLSWRLIMAEDDVIDYIIVHELAHMYKTGHSEEYWGLAECILRDYKERIVKLRALQERILGEDWD